MYKVFMIIEALDGDSDRNQQLTGTYPGGVRTATLAGVCVLVQNHYGGGRYGSTSSAPVRGGTSRW